MFLEGDITVEKEIVFIVIVKNIQSITLFTNASNSKVNSQIEEKCNVYEMFYKKNWHP